MPRAWKVAIQVRQKTRGRCANEFICTSRRDELTELPVTDKETEHAYEEARAHYERALRAYGDALALKLPGDVRRLFDEATAAWDRVRTFNCIEGEMDADAHLVGAFSLAVQTGAPAEAKRLYEAMSEEYRHATDAAEMRAPGTVKIWLRP